MGMYLSLSRINESELEEIRQEPERLEEYLDNETSLSLDKSWHAIHFMLTGNTWDSDNDLDKAILTGNIVGEEGDEDFDYGYGPATYLTADEVKEIATNLLNINVDKLKSEFTLSMFADKEIYVFSSQDSVEDEDEEKEYIFENLESLIQYYQEAAAKNQLIIKMIM